MRSVASLRRLWRFAAIRWSAAIVFGSLVGAAAADPSPESASSFADAIPSAIAHDSAMIRGTRVTYELRWSETAITDSQGIRQGTVSGVSYIRTDIPNSSDRPIVFAFGGGPGASASALNFRFLGPKRQLDEPSAGSGSGAPQHPQRLVDNEASLLDLADLVLIDTPGSGFSRPLRQGGLSFFWTAPHDAEAVEAYIRQWLTENRRGSSPLFIVGESYGGYRIGVMAPRLADLDIAGLVMISPALDLTDQPGSSGIPDAHFVFNFPTEAVAAWAHHRGISGSKTAQDVFRRAAGFAQTDLLIALQLGSALPQSQRDLLALKMSRMLGLPADEIAQANLRIDPQRFLETLLPGRIVGRLDTRVSGPAKPAPGVAGRSKQADDPALGLGASNIVVDSAVGDFLRSIGVKTQAPYVRLNLEMNLHLDWAYGSRVFEDIVRLNPTPNVALLMSKRPKLRLLLIGGYYDMTIPVLGPRYAITHSEIPLSRFRAVAFDGPHAVYETPETRRLVASELHELVEGRMVPRL